MVGVGVVLLLIIYLIFSWVFFCIVSGLVFGIKVILWILIVNKYDDIINVINVYVIGIYI